MTINELIQSTLLLACSGITSNVYYYLVATTKEFTTNDTVVTYELNNTANEHTAELRNVIRTYDVIIKIASNKQSTIQNLRVFICNNMLKLSGGNIGYISLTNEEQPIYEPENMMYSSSTIFNIMWVR